MGYCTKQVPGDASQKASMDCQCHNERTYCLEEDFGGQKLWRI